MSALTVPIVVVGIALTVFVFAFGVHRLLGLRLSPLRALIGGVIALACASPIITAIGGSIPKHNGKWPFNPAVWFVILQWRSRCWSGWWWSSSQRRWCRAELGPARCT